MSSRPPPMRVFEKGLKPLDVLIHTTPALSIIFATEEQRHHRLQAYGNRQEIHSMKRDLNAHELEVVCLEKCRVDNGRMAQLVGSYTLSILTRHISWIPTETSLLS